MSPLHEAIARIRVHVAQVLEVARVGQGLSRFTTRVVGMRGEHVPHEVGADESRAAGHEDLHARTPGGVHERRVSRGRAPRSSAPTKSQGSRPSSHVGGVRRELRVHEVDDAAAGGGQVPDAVGHAGRDAHQARDAPSPEHDAAQDVLGGRARAHVQEHQRASCRDGGTNHTSVWRRWRWKALIDARIHLAVVDLLAPRSPGRPRGGRR